MSIKSISEEQDIASAKAMGDQYAEKRGLELIKVFLCETGLVDQEYELHKDTAEKPLDPKRFLDLLAKDYLIPFNRIMSMCYSMGFLDAKQNVSRLIYAPGPAKIERQGVEL